MKYSSRLHLTAAAAAVFAALAASSSAAVAAEETVSTETVKVTAARVEQELMDVNMSVSVITADDIRKSETLRRRTSERHPRGAHQQRRRPGYQARQYPW